MELQIEDINIIDNLDDFKCNNPLLNSYFTRDAYFEHIMKFTNTKIIKIGREIVAYFSMQFKYISIIEEYDEYNYPVIYLKCLAVDEKYENSGIGTSILQYISVKAEEISNFIGCRCLLIDALRERVSWYEDRGFQYVSINKNQDIYNATIPMFIDFRNENLLIDYFEEV